LNVQAVAKTFGISDNISEYRWSVKYVMKNKLAMVTSSTAAWDPFCEECNGANTEDWHRVVGVYTADE